MKVLITGAKGQLGRALIQSAPPGLELFTADRFALDLANGDALRRAVLQVRPDLVINAAAYTAVDRAESEPELAFAINAKAVGVIAAAVEEIGGTLVQISTDFVFDGNTARPYVPSDARSPLSIYGSSKAAGEDAAGTNAVVVRTQWVHGAGGVNFVSTMLRLMGTSEEVRVVADQVGAPTWTVSLVKVIWKLGMQGMTGPWHWTDAGVASWYDYAVAIQEEALALGLLGRPVRVVPVSTKDYPMRAKRPAYALLNSFATREALGLPGVHWRHNLRQHLVGLLESSPQTQSPQVRDCP